MTTYSIKSLGCKISQYDGEKIAEYLQAYGLKEDSRNPDLYILNGCSVTARASQKVRQILRSAKRKWPEAKLVLAGCEARLRDQRSEVTPEADWILLSGTELDEVESMLKALQLDFIEELSHQPIVGTLSTSRTRAYLKVQDGCNQFCSYCIVSHLRGDEWSKPMEDAVKEASTLVKTGHRELVVTGIHLGHFRPGLHGLARALEAVDGVERIRFSSIESVEVNEDLIKWMAQSPKACQHFHLPLQSGCDRILKLMRRPYLTQDFYDVVEKIREKMPYAAITTDLIVGFPGETEDDFVETLNFLEKIGFSRIHIFRYSKRDGTPAAKMPNQIENKVKLERAERVDKLWKDLEKKYFKKFIGQKIEVLWETCDDNVWNGLSGEYVPCKVSGSSENLENRISEVIGKKVISDHEKGSYLEVEIVGESR